MKNVLILGGTGFIGSHISNSLANQGYNVSIISRSPNLYYPLDSSCKIFLASIESMEMLSKLNIDWEFNYIINACGNGDHSNFSDAKYDIIGGHLIGTINIIRLIKRKNLQRYIHLGSSEEYGQLENPSSETMRESPLTPYGFAKTASTHFLQMLYRSEGFPAIILRPFLVYGENQSSEKLIPYVVDSCIKNLDFKLTDGNQLREFININDMVNLVSVILESKNKSINGKIYDVTSGDVFTISEIVNIIQEMIGTGTPKFGSLDKRKSDISLLYSSSNKLLNDLGWKNKISLKNNLKSIINYRRKNIA